MKILQAHNFYKLSGGEDTVVRNEEILLKENGHQLYSYNRYNKEIDSFNLSDKIKLIKDTTWSQRSYNDFSNLLKKIKPDICHVHNFLPLISPSIYYACKDHHIPVVQTLHNFRLICTNGLLLRDGKICEDCLGKSPYGAVLKKCYRSSYIQTYSVARMLSKNTAMGTWTNLVDAYLCFTQFAKDKFISHGIPQDKIYLKPNFVDIKTEATSKKEDYFIYVGRLEQNKGVQLFKKINNELSIPLKIVGEGNLTNDFSNKSNIELLGQKSHEETIELIKNARALLLPSLSYEGMPMTILEAFATKTLVIASNLGAMQTMINHKKNGLLFQANSASELKQNLKFALKNTTQIESIIENAYADYENLYSKKANYKRLMEIYNKLINHT